MTQSTTTATDVANWKKLSESQVDKLWAEKVTNASFIAKITGWCLLDYAWFRGEAVEKDVALNVFKGALKDYVKAVDKSALTAAEATGLGPIHYNNAAQQCLDSESLATAKKAEKTFFKAFKTLTTKLGVDSNSSEAIDMAKSVIVGLKEEVKIADTKQRNNLKDKIEARFKNSFSARVFDDMIKSYANQDINAITCANFKKKVTDLNTFFPSNTPVSIENSLRAALISVAEKKTAITTLSAAYLDANPNNAHVAARKAALKVELDASKAAMDAKIATLCGNNGWNGTINDAVVAQNTAQGEFDTALAAARQAWGAAPNAGSDADAILAFDLTNGTATQPQKDARAVLATKDEALKAAKKLVADRTAELATVAVWEHGNRRGKIYEVEQKLNLLDTTARADVTNSGDLLAELATPVVAGQEAVRSAALNAILNRP